MVGAVITRHWPALVRDVLALGYRPTDLFTKLSFSEVACIIIASPPNSAVRHSVDKGWSREAHLLANMAEGEAGIAKIKEPYQRPGVTERQSDDPTQNPFFTADALTWEEFDRREKERYDPNRKHVKRPGSSHSRALQSSGPRPVPKVNELKFGRNRK